LSPGATIRHPCGAKNFARTKTRLRR
jgi:hypothetical protein